MAEARKLDNGGSAFPQYDRTFGAGTVTGGMTLRDYFAAHCPDSALPKSVTWGDIIKFKRLPSNSRIEEWKDEWTEEYFATARYAYADAMIRARAAQGEG